MEFVSFKSIQSALARALTLETSAKAIHSDGSITVGSSVGLARKRNEDCCLVAQASYADAKHENFVVAVVCDGLGGMSQGREAAILAASTFTACVCSATSLRWERRLEHAINQANAAVYHLLRGSGGTTLSAVLSSFDGQRTLCHVGDSRIYGLLPNRVLEQLSREDTISAILNKREGNAEVPKDSRLLQFVGMGDEMEAQIAGVSSEFWSILITSDGAHDAPNAVLQRVANASASGKDLVRKLLALSEIFGGRDNASALLIQLDDQLRVPNRNDADEFIITLPNQTLNIITENSRAHKKIEPFEEANSEISNHERPEQIHGMTSTQKMESQVAPKQRRVTSLLKDKQRMNAPGKTKRRSEKVKEGAAVQLPLASSDVEIDVEFSSPVKKVEENK